MIAINYNERGSDSSGTSTCGSVSVRQTPQVEEAVKQLHEATAGLLQVVGDLKERLQPVLPEMMTNKIDKTDLEIKDDPGLVPLATNLHQIKRHMHTATGTVQDIIDKCEL